jgi:hypothetical protein
MRPLEESSKRRWVIGKTSPLTRDSMISTKKSSKSKPKLLLLEALMSSITQHQVLVLRGKPQDRPQDKPQVTPRAPLTNI